MESNVRILFIDDQPSFLESMTFWMKSKGYEVLVAEDGLKGIEAVRNNQADVAFVDFKMPGINGVDVIKKIREFNKTIPIIIVTAHADDVLLYQTKDVAISGFFSKMGNFEDLDRILDVALRHLKKLKSESPSREV